MELLAFGLICFFIYYIYNNKNEEQADYDMISYIGADGGIQLRLI